MLQAVFNIFRIPELRNRVLFTLGILVVYRMGFWIPIPGIDQSLRVGCGDGRPVRDQIDAHPQRRGMCHQFHQIGPQGRLASGEADRWNLRIHGNAA